MNLKINFLFLIMTRGVQWMFINRGVLLEQPFIRQLIRKIIDLHRKIDFFFERQKNRY